VLGLEEAEHLHHTTGSCRERWLVNLGMKAVLAPPEEQEHVRTAIGAGKAKHAREHMARASGRTGFRRRSRA